MTNQHPITPSPELIQKWCGGSVQQWWKDTNGDIHEFLILATQAAQWGADQELAACCEWLRREYPWRLAAALRLPAERRPQPPSLKEQALEQLRALQQCGAGHRDTDKILQALESL